MWVRLATLVRHNLVLRLRDPGHLVSYLVMPMVLMLAFEPLYAASVSNGKTQAVVGMLVMFSVLSLSVVGAAMLTERIWRTWDRLRMSPVSVPELLLGKTIPVFVLLVAQQALLLVFGVFVVGMSIPGPLPLVAFAVVVWSVTLLALGSALATLVRSFGEMSAICDVGALAVSALGGALAPISTLPHWAQVIAPASPGYWAVTMLEDAVSGDVSGVLACAMVLGCVAVAAGLLAGARVTRGLSALRG